MVKRRVSKIATSNTKERSKYVLDDAPNCTYVTSILFNCSTLRLENCLFVSLACWLNDDYLMFPEQWNMNLGATLASILLFVSMLSNEAWAL